MLSVSPETEYSALSRNPFTADTSRLRIFIIFGSSPTLKSSGAYLHLRRTDSAEIDISRFFSNDIISSQGITFSKSAFIFI